jgi:hypothetical protein
MTQQIQSQVDHFADDANSEQGKLRTRSRLERRGCVFQLDRSRIESWHQKEAGQLDVRLPGMETERPQTTQELAGSKSSSIADCHLIVVSAHAQNSTEIYLDGERQGSSARRIRPFTAAHLPNRSRAPFNTEDW